MEPTRLNVFQRVLRQWDALHPYNAAQVLQLSGAPDIDMLTQRWNQTLSALGIGPLHVRDNRFWFDAPDGTLQPMCLPEGMSLDQFMTDEMNRAFDPEDGLPFRPFILRQDDSYFAGVVYHHWVADSASIRLLVREWFFRCFDPSRARNDPVPIARGGYWHYFGSHTSRWELDQGFVSMFPWFSRFRRVRRIESPGISDFAMRFTHHEFPDGSIDAIRAAAREKNVTVNDYFLAAMAQACDKYVPAQRTSRRQDLALGTIVDLRARGTGEKLGDAFGLFLGFTSVIVGPRELRDFDRMATNIARQTQLHKVNGVPESSMLRMTGGLVFNRFFNHDQKKLMNFYRKRFPLSAGISNINLNGSWPEEYHPSPLLNYIRVSPTGPLMPVVFTTTTLGKRLHFGLGTRNSIVPPNDAQLMAQTFRDCVLSKAGTSA